MRILILSDIHGNLAALETVLHAAESQYDKIWCLGDVVGYGPRPNECVAMIRERADLCVIGNHDWAVLGRPGVNVDDFNPQARQAVLWTRKQLTAENRAYLNQLPDSPVQPTSAEHFLITHASPREPVWEYILTPTIAMENFAVFTQPYCLVGHTHKPAIFRWQLHLIPADVDVPVGEAAESGSQGVDPGRGSLIATVTQHRLPQPGECIALVTDSPQRLILNPGSVGQPRDNDARAAYAILDLDRMSWRQERAAYPVDLTQSQMRAAGLPKRLVDRLSFGW